MRQDTPAREIARDPEHAPIRTTQDAIRTARRLLDEAEAHYLLRLYRPEDARLTDELSKCLTLARVAVAMAKDLEADTYEGAA